MTHKQIWTEIAEAFLTREDEGAPSRLRLAESGLCLAFTLLSRFVPTEVFRSAFYPSYDEAYWLPTRRDKGHTIKCDLIRGDFATLMSCMTEEEFDQLLAGTPAQQRRNN